MKKQTIIQTNKNGSLKIFSEFGDFLIPKNKVYSFYYTLIQAIHHLEENNKLFDTYGKPIFSDIFSKENIEPAESLSPDQQQIYLYSK